MKFIRDLYYNIKAIYTNIKNWYIKNDVEDNTVEFKHYHIKYTKLDNLINWFTDNQEDYVNAIKGVIFLYKQSQNIWQGFLMKQFGILKKILM
jgi:hypothetical protein